MAASIKIIYQGMSERAKSLVETFPDALSLFGFHSRSIATNVTNNKKRSAMECIMHNGFCYRITHFVKCQLFVREAIPL